METVTVELTDNEEATVERVIKRRGMEESTSWYLRHAAIELPLAERRAARLEEENRALGERAAALQRDVVTLQKAAYIAQVVPYINRAGQVSVPVELWAGMLAVLESFRSEIETAAVDMAILQRARALDAQRREAADRAYDAHDAADAARSTREQIERGELSN